jgi:hypothetical protein
LSNRRVACFVVAGATAVTLAGYSATAQRFNRALVAEQATQDFIQPQTPNRGAKTHRLSIKLASLGTDQPMYALASAMPDAAETPADPVIASAPKIPEIAAPAEPKIEAKPEVKQAEPKKPEPKVTAVAPAPEKHAEKPKHLPPPPAPPKENAVLDDGQISGLKGRLRLTSDQVEYWPAVEAALRDVVRTQLRGSRLATGRVNIDVNAPEVQKLIWAAMPLIMRLREDQKTEVRKLARVIGLEQVASQI